MTEDIVDLPQLDTPPRSGVFVEHDQLTLTKTETDEGHRLGRDIDPDDDSDNGLD